MRSRPLAEGARQLHQLLGQRLRHLLFGDQGNDIISGGTGGDTITGGAGNDSIMGDAGTDIAVFTGPIENYAFGTVGDTQTITISDLTGLDGDDTLATLKRNGMEVLPPSAQLRADMRRVGDTILKEWLDRAGAEGKALLDAYRR